jgi:hypothetical protein
MSEFANTEKPVRLQAAAEFLGVSLKTVTRLKDERKLQAFPIRGRWFTRMSYVQAYIDQQLQNSQRRLPC